MIGPKNYKIYFLKGIYEGQKLVRSGGSFYLSRGQTPLIRRLLLGAEGVREATKTECQQYGNYVVLSDENGKNHYMLYYRGYTDVDNPCNKEFRIIQAINPWTRNHVLRLPLVVHAKDKDTAVKTFLCMHSDKPYTSFYSRGSASEMSDFEERRKNNFYCGSTGTEGYLVLHCGNNEPLEVWIWRSETANLALERIKNVGVFV